MLKFTATITFLLSVLTAQITAPFELELRTRLVNDDRTMVNIQITNLMDKPLDYVEGFVIEKDFNKKLIDENDWSSYTVMNRHYKKDSPQPEVFLLINHKMTGQILMNF